MGRFKQQYLSWMIVSAAAICVTCQELTSTLRNGNYACRGEEVIFTCTIRGSLTLTNLILAWSSTEYIGQGDPLRFTSDGVPGMNVTSMINGNVTAILINNTKFNINGIPELVSELRLVADRASTVTCRSITTSGTMSNVFNISDVPEAPLNVGATEVSRSENDCEILVKLDPPANSDDIIHYTVYVPALNMSVIASMLSSVVLRNCPERFDIEVAAVNRFGCVGISVRVPVQLPLQSTSPASPTSPEPSTSEPSTSEPSTPERSTPESSAMSISTVVGGASGGIIALILIIAVSIIVLIMWLYYRQRKVVARYQILNNEGYQKLYEDIKKSAVEVLQDLLQQLYVGLRAPSYVEVQIPARALVRKVKSSNSDYIKEAIMNILKTIDMQHHEYFLEALKTVEVIIPDLSKTSRTLDAIHKQLVQKLETEGDSSESMETALENLKRIVREAPPDDVKKLLLKACEKLDEELVNRKDELFRDSSPIAHMYEKSHSGEASKGSGDKQQTEEQTQGQAENVVYSEGISQQQLEVQIEQTATGAESKATMTDSNPAGHDSIPMHPIKPHDDEETSSRV